MADIKEGSVYSLGLYNIESSECAKSFKSKLKQLKSAYKYVFTKTEVFVLFKLIELKLKLELCVSVKLGSAFEVIETLYE